MLNLALDIGPKGFQASCHMKRLGSGEMLYMPKQKTQYFRQFATFLRKSLKMCILNVLAKLSSVIAK